MCGIRYSLKLVLAKITLFTFSRMIEMTFLSAELSLNQTHRKILYFIVEKVIINLLLIYFSY